jgi:hypothetical protein
MPTLIDEWVTRWEGLYGSKYVVTNGAKMGKLFKTLSEALGRDEFLSRMGQYFTSDDPKVAETKHSADWFCATINRHVASPSVETWQAARDVRWALRTCPVNGLDTGWLLRADVEFAGDTVQVSVLYPDRLAPFRGPLQKAVRSVRPGSTLEILEWEP